MSPISSRLRPLSRHRFVLFTIAAISLVLALGSLTIPFAGAEEDADAKERKVLRDSVSFYPRLVRLANSGDANGNVIASVVSITGSGHIAAIYESTDDGASYKQVGEIADPKAAGSNGMCCATLYELPSQVGDMPAGTLLWVGSVGTRVPAKDRHIELRMWKSTDHGRNWEFQSTISRSPTSEGIGEPELSVSNDGQLVAHFVDENHDGHSQRIMQARTATGKNPWTSHTTTIASKVKTDRPGMPVVRKLPNGTFFMTFEICSGHAKYHCVVHFRTSKDGWNWGDKSYLGVRPQTSGGKFFAHSPTVTFAPDPSNPKASKIYIIGQVLKNSNGSGAPENGNAVLTNTANGSGNWKLEKAPVPVNKPYNNPCPNYSSPLLPSADGSRLIGVATDYDGKTCKAYYGTTT